MYLKALNVINKARREGVQRKNPKGHHYLKTLMGMVIKSSKEKTIGKLK